MVTIDLGFNLIPIKEYVMLMGVQRRKHKVAEGNFTCPQCKNHTRFQRFQDAPYFTVLGIPLYKTTEMVVDYVECTSCQRHFHTSRHLDLEMAA
jgi:transcription elongation factor Elf1